MNLQFFSDEGAAPSGAENGGDNAGNQGDQQPANVGENQMQQDRQSQQQNQRDQQQSEKMIPQSDVNNLIAKEKKKATERLLKELGIDDFENAKEGLQKFREWQESQKTEQEKQQELLKTLQTDNQEKDKTISNLQAQVAALKNDVKADSVEDVIALAERLVNDDVTIDDAIKQIIEKYPQFKQQEEQQVDDKPNFTTGQHQKQPQSEMDKWLQAFKQ